MQQAIFKRPIKNIYVIIDILGYSIDDITLICNFLHSCSKRMRNMLKKYYIVIKNRLYCSHYSHCEFQALIQLTHNYKTSRAAHQRLLQIMKRECEKATKIDYGLEMLPETLLQIADDEWHEWLLQPELKAIQDGLTYVSWKEERGHRRYRGYLNAQGQKQGVGIIKFDNLIELRMA